MTSPVLPKLVGQRIKRREDPRLIQGRATYVDDIKVAGMQHLAFKRSDIAHGRIRSIDASAAQAMDGVEAVLHGRADRRARGADAHRHTVAVARASRGGRRYGAVRRRARGGRRRARPLRGARRRRRDRRVAYDPLPAVVDPELAMTGQPTVIHPAFPNNLALAGHSRRHRRVRQRRRRHGDRQGLRRRRRGHLAADGEPPSGAQRDRAARRRRSLRAGQGHDDDLVVHAEPARRCARSSRP